MAVEITKEKYPAFDAETGTSGKRRVIYINYGEGATEEEPKWILLGGVTDQTVTWGAAVSTSATKDTGYWQSGVVTGKTFAFNTSVMLKKDNEGQAVIDHFMANDEITASKKALQFAFVDLDTLEYTVVKAIPTQWQERAAANAMITKELQATGVGQPEVKSKFVIPGTV